MVGAEQVRQTLCGTLTFSLCCRSSTHCQEIVWRDRDWFPWCREWWSLGGSFCFFVLSFGIGSHIVAQTGLVSGPLDKHILIKCTEQGWRNCPRGMRGEDFRFLWGLLLKGVLSTAKALGVAGQSPQKKSSRGSLSSPPQEAPSQAPFFPSEFSAEVWWHTPVTPAQTRLRQNDLESKASVQYETLS